MDRLGEHRRDRESDAQLARGLISYGAPMSAPWTTSSRTAQSWTERVNALTVVKPRQASPSMGQVGVRPRVGLRPTRPQHNAGIRIEPPPSEAWAKGAMRAAIAAPEPPLEPPGVRLTSQGLRQTPSASGSVTGARPNSGVLVLATNTSPALR
jgi:hypothetical protein